MIILKFLLGFLVLSSVFGIAYFMSWLNKKLPDLKMFLVVGFFAALAVYVVVRGSLEIGELLLSLMV